MDHIPWPNASEQQRRIDLNQGVYLASLENAFKLLVPRAVDTQAFFPHRVIFTEPTTRVYFEPPRAFQYFYLERILVAYQNTPNAQNEFPQGPTLRVLLRANDKKLYDVSNKLNIDLGPQEADLRNFTSPNVNKDPSTPGNNTFYHNAKNHRYFFMSLGIIEMIFFGFDGTNPVSADIALIGRGIANRRVSEETLF